MSLAVARDRLTIPPRTVLLVLGGIAGAQVLLLAIYVHSMDIPLKAFHLYPLVWITVGCWVFWRVRPVPSPTRRQVIAVGVGLAYLLLIGYIGGLFGPGYLHGTTSLADGTGAEVIAGARFVGLAPPGYGPAVLYVGAYLSVALVPYLVIGYASLAYLVSVAVLDAWRATAPAALGAFACIGCSWPLLASLVTGTGGLVGSVAAGAYSLAYPVSTIAYLLAVTLLVLRPGVDP